MKKLSFAILTLLLLISRQPLWAEELKLGCTNWLPFVDKTLPRQGAVMEIVSTAFQRQGISSTPAIMPWARVLEMGENGSVIVACVWHTEERARKFLLSEPFLVNRVSLLKRKQLNLPWQTMQDLKPYTFAVERKASYGEEFDLAGYLVRHSVADSKLQVKMVINGHVDMAPISEGSALHYISQLPLEQRKQLNFAKRSLVINNLHIMVSRNLPDHQEIISAFNKGLRSMLEDGSYNQILEHYSFERFRYPPDPLLTDESSRELLEQILK